MHDAMIHSYKRLAVLRYEQRDSYDIPIRPFQGQRRNAYQNLNKTSEHQIPHNLHEGALLVQRAGLGYIGS